MDQQLLNKYMESVTEIQRIMVHSVQEIDSKKVQLGEGIYLKFLLGQLELYIKELALPTFGRQEVKKATPVELNAYCKTLRVQLESNMRLNQAGFKGASEKLPLLMSLSMYSKKYATETMLDVINNCSEEGDLYQTQINTLLPIKEIYQFLLTIKDEGGILEKYMAFASRSHKKKIKKHSESTLLRLEFGEAELIGGKTPSRKWKRTYSVGEMISNFEHLTTNLTSNITQNIQAVRRKSIMDTPFSSIKGSEAPMLLLNLLKLYDQG